MQSKYISIEVKQTFTCFNLMNVLISLDIAKKLSSSKPRLFSGDSSSKAKASFKSLKPKLIATLTGSNEDQP